MMPVGDRMRIGVVGASGFIGSNVMAVGLAMGLDVRPVKVTRSAPQERGDVPLDLGRAWARSHPAEFEALTHAVAGLDVVVNAAGLARPACRKKAALMAANVVLPAALAVACRRGDVRRLVHVSTAAVQGRLDPLDETDRSSPFSPYSSSKAEAERWLCQAGPADRPEELVVYRPTSVHGPRRAISRLLCGVAGAPMVALGGAGDQPLPVTLVDNVAAGVLFSATSPAVMPIVIQPWEGMTTRRLFELLGARRFFSVPDAPIRSALRAVRRPAGATASTASAVRILELLYLGQHVAESGLTRAGFVPPVGPEGWAALVDASSRRDCHLPPEAFSE